MDFTPYIPILSIVGFISLLKKDIAKLIFYLLLLLPNLFFFISWGTGTPLLPTYLILLLFAVEGFILILSFCKRERCLQISLLFLIIEIIISFPRANKLSYFTTRTFTIPDYLFSQKDGVMISSTSWFNLRAIQDLERTRDDLKILTAGNIFDPDFFSPIDPHRFPNLKHYSTIDKNYNYINFIKKNIPLQPVYVESSISINPELYFCCPLHPGEKNFFRYDLLHPLNKLEFTNYLKRLTNYLSIDLDNGLTKDNNEFTFVGSNIQGWAFYARYLGQWAVAIKFYKLLQKWYYRDMPAYKKEININIGTTYLESGSFDKAEYYYKKAMPEAKAYFNLAVLYYNEGNFRTAVSYINQYVEHLKKEPQFDFYYLLKAKILFKLGNLKKAKKYFIKAIDKATHFLTIRESRKFLKCIKENNRKCEEQPVKK